MKDRSSHGQVKGEMWPGIEVGQYVLLQYLNKTLDKFSRLYRGPMKIIAIDRQIIKRWRSDDRQSLHLPILVGCDFSGILLARDWGSIVRRSDGRVWCRKDSGPWREGSESTVFEVWSPMGWIWGWRCLLVRLEFDERTWTDIASQKNQSFRQKCFQTNVLDTLLKS